MTEINFLWHKAVYGIAFCFFSSSSVWLAFQLASGRVINGQRRSFVIGALTGLTAATMYVSIWLAVNAFRLLIEPGYADLRELLQVLVAFSLNALWFGLLPAALAGGVTGMSIAYILHRAAPLSGYGAAGVGIALCVGFVLLWHLALVCLSFYLTDNGNPFAYTPLFYLLFIGLPALIYIVVGARLSSLASQYLKTR